MASGWVRWLHLSRKGSSSAGAAEPLPSAHVCPPKEVLAYRHPSFIERLLMGETASTGPPASLTANEVILKAHQHQTVPPPSAIHSTPFLLVQLLPPPDSARYS